MSLVILLDVWLHIILFCFVLLVPNCTEVLSCLSWLDFNSLPLFLFNLLFWCCLYCSVLLFRFCEEGRLVTTPVACDPLYLAASVFASLEHRYSNFQV